MGEMSKIEEVARAIAEKYHGEPCESAGFIFVECAKAAIEAMRGPTEAMVEAGTEARWRSAVRDANSIREIWDAGIEAALKE